MCQKTFLGTKQFGGAQKYFGGTAPKCPPRGYGPDLQWKELNLDRMHLVVL